MRSLWLSVKLEEVNYFYLTCIASVSLTSGALSSHLDHSTRLTHSEKILQGHWDDAPRLLSTQDIYNNNVFDTSCYIRTSFAFTTLRTSSTSLPHHLSYVAAMTRQIFKGRSIAAAGPLPGQLTVENLKRWTQLRKGVFTQDLTEETTHLLCTEEQFRKRAPRGKHILLPRLRIPHPLYTRLLEKL